MKKLWLLFMVLATATSAWAAGGRSSSPSSPSGTAGTAGGLKYASLPYVNDGRTRVSMIVRYGPVPTISSYDYADNVFTQKMVRETGVQLDIINLSGADATTRLNVMLSTNDYADIIVSDTSVNDLGYWANQGILQALDQYNALSYPNTKALVEQYPFLLTKIKGSDGKIYGLPGFQECIHCIYGNRVFYHMPWVRDKYGNKTPTTLDEFAAYLRFIRDNDVNGNGNRNDEIPLAVDVNSVGVFIAYFASSFLPWTTGNYGAGIANVNGRVVDQAKDPAFREALRYLAGLYKEGLIAPNSFSMTEDELRSLAQADPPVLASFPTGWKTIYLSTETPRQIQSFSLTPLAGPNGVRYASHSDTAESGYAKWLVTDKSKDPELAVALYDYIIKFENMMDATIGPKGIVWDYPDSGAVGMDGGKPLYKRISAQGGVALNSWWDKGAPIIYPETWFSGAQTTGVAEAKRYHETGDPTVEDYLLHNVDYIELMWNMIAKGHAQYAVPDSYYVPAAILSDDDSTRLSEINASLNTYKTQAWVEFITGVRNIDNNTEWNTYLADLDRYGSGELATIVQKYNK